MTYETASISEALAALGMADQSHYFLRIGDLPDDAFLVENVTLDGWTFHQDYTLTLKVLTRHQVDADTLINQPATFFVQSGHLLPVHGVVTNVADADGNGDCEGLTLTLGSVLHRLNKQQHNRVFTDQSADDIAAGILKDALGDISALERLCDAMPVLPMTVQYEESDYDFVRRILAREGVYLHLHQAESETIVQLVDDLTQLTEGEHPIPLRYAPNAGIAKNDEHIYKATRERASAPGLIQLADTNAWARTNPSSEQPVNLPFADGTQHHWGLNTPTSDRSDALGKRLAEVHTWQASTLVFETTCRQLRPGSRIELSDHPDFNGHYRVIEVQFEGSQRAAAGNGLGGQDKPFQCRVTVLPADLPYRPPYKARTPVYGTFTCLIEEEVDERGLYRLRLPFDNRTNADGPASLPVRMAQPLGGEDHGLHFPLEKGAEVAVTCENGDLDRPVILGALYNQSALNPVTDANARHNLIQTRAGQRFLMDDTPQQERIELANPSDANQLTLSAEKDAHLAKLESKEGDVILHAGRAMTLESGQNQTTSVGADHSVHVQQNQSLMTQEGSITVEAATDIEYSAGENLRWQSREGEMTVTSEGAMHWQVGNGMTQQIDKGDYRLLVQEGALQAEAQTDITFSGVGSGRICFQQGNTLMQLDNSSFTIDAGMIELTGDTIVIKGGTIGNN